MKVSNSLVGDLYWLTFETRANKDNHKSKWQEVDQFEYRDDSILNPMTNKQIDFWIDQKVSMIWHAHTTAWIMEKEQNIHEIEKIY